MLNKPHSRGGFMDNETCTVCFIANDIETKVNIKGFSQAWELSTILSNNGVNVLFIEDEKGVKCPV